MPRLLLIAAALLLAVFPAPCDAQRVFNVARSRPERVVVSLSEQDPLPFLDSSSTEPGMTARLAGILAVLESQDDLRRLYACVGPDSPAARTRQAQSDDTSTRLYVFHLYARDTRRRIEIRRTFDGQIFAQPIDVDDNESSSPHRLKVDAFSLLAAQWNPYRGDLASSPPTPAPAPSIEPGRQATLDQPYEPGLFTMDQPTLSERFFSRRSSRFPPAKRILAHETINIRLPSGGVDPRSPAGLLVWIDPSPGGNIPQSLGPALDHLGFIAVAPMNADNQRPVGDRLQLALDAVATAMDRYHIDRRRIYASGLSGGGKMSALLWAGFPELFAGAIPVVGFEFWEKIPSSRPGQPYRALIARPEPQRLDLIKTHRLALMTGAKDFNHEPIAGAAEILGNQGFASHLYDFRDMGHEVPTADRFTEAMLWLDHPRRSLLEQQAGEAQSLLDAYAKGSAPPPPTTDAQREALINITRVGPWSPAAWKAAELLGAAQPSPMNATPPATTAP
ncbi:MAG: prolyl oligopeptidase family serine peptidase [Phycisphaeraceae bacterium]|nr:prolyl oligopeptidase family serine peptidase [Phycisphaeraceae bacterium]